MATPQAIIDFNPTLNSLCPKWTPLKIKGLLVHWLRQHFATQANLSEPGITDRVWTDADETEIIIETSGRWKPQTTEKRPALIIHRGSLKPVRQGIANDRLMGAGAQAVHRQLHSTLFTMDLTVWCLAIAEGEVESLSTEVYKEVHKFAIKFVEKLGVIRVQLLEIGPLARLEEAREHFGVPVSISFTFWESWELDTRDTAILDRITLTTTLT